MQPLSLSKTKRKLTFSIYATFSQTKGLDENYEQETETEPDREDVTEEVFCACVCPLQFLHCAIKVPICVMCPLNIHLFNISTTKHFMNIFF